MKKAYLIAFYDIRAKTITRMQTASEFPVSQMDLGRVYQLLVTHAEGVSFQVALWALQDQIRGPILQWTHEYLRPKDLQR